MIGKLRRKKYYSEVGEIYVTDKFHIEGQSLTELEINKSPLRFVVINYLIKTLKRKTTYLEIGVRNPEHNFNKIEADSKYSVDPGVEFKPNPVDFKMTSDDFFRNLKAGDILSPGIKFDVIFVDGLHLADQADRDILNALTFIKDDGFIVVHDCNPPTEFHARETLLYDKSPSKGCWNGTTWKAFYKHRLNSDVTSCCIDSDWGIGIITKRKVFSLLQTNNNPFYEYHIFNENRTEHLGLIDFDTLQTLVSR